MLLTGLAGLLRAVSKFRRLKGHRGMPTLLKALEGVVRGEPIGTSREVAWQYPAGAVLIFNLVVRHS